MRRIVIVSDKMQRGYRYVLSAPAGRNFDPNHAAFAHNAAHIQQQRLQLQLIPAAHAGE